MVKLCFILQCIVSSVVIENSRSISSPLAPFTTYKHSIELQKDVADLWWTVDDNEREIIFELHINTTGWIALGISPAGGMNGADIGVGWVDQIGSVYFQDRYASANGRPMFDNTTIDWFVVQGREVSGWTAIQFKRLLDTCDNMDVPIKLKEWLLNQTWTPERAVQWQEFYNTASRVLVYGAAPSRQYNVIPSLPKYQDFKPVPCTKDQTINQTTTIPGQTTSSQSTTTNKARSYISTLRRNVLVFLNMILIVMTIIFD
ncbi:unnamed protein product [Rotaria sp. Silwood1]|nr:unnamed protein product [Rotaria sp. Silwood1]